MRQTFKASKIKKLEKLIRRLWDIVDNDMEAKEVTGQRKHFSASYTIIFTLITA